MWWFDLGPVIYIIRRQTAPLRRQSGSDHAKTKRAHCARTFLSTTPPLSPVRQMLAQRHARRESIEGSSRLLFNTHNHLLSYSPCTSPVILELGPLGAAPRVGPLCQVLSFTAL